MLVVVQGAPSNVDKFTSCLYPIVAYQSGSTEYEQKKSQSVVTLRSRPLLVVSAETAEIVAHIIKCARYASLRVCPRSGGHALDGRSLCNNGVMIDLAAIRSSSVDSHGTATIGAGSTLGEALWTVHKRGR